MTPQADVSEGKYPAAADGTPLFKQADPEWGGRKLGRAGATIAQSGCAMTASAMAMSKVSGQLVTPKDLDAWLDKHRGYSADSLDWSRVGLARGLEVKHESFRLANIDAQLGAGRPVVIGIDYKEGSAGGANGTDHWVCITGKEVDERGKPYYLANDPGTGKVIKLRPTARGGLTGDGADALGRYKSTGQLRVFLPTE